MTTKTDGDRLLRAAVALLARGNHAASREALRVIVEDVAPGRIDREKKRLANARARLHEEARWAGPVPAWVKRLVTKYDDVIKVVWTPEARDSSSGRYHNVFPHGRITINAGTDELDQRIVVLHEVAHSRTVGHGHDEVFWDELYRICVAEHFVEAAKDRFRHTRGIRAAQRRARQSA